MFAFALLSVGSPLALLVYFIIFACIVAAVIILGRWLLGLTGLTIPQPLQVVLGIVVFLVLLLMFLNYTGLFVF